MNAVYRNKTGFFEAIIDGERFLFSGQYGAVQFLRDNGVSDAFYAGPGRHNLRGFGVRN